MNVLIAQLVKATVCTSTSSWQL